MNEYACGRSKRSRDAIVTDECSLLDAPYAEAYIASEGCIAKRSISSGNEWVCVELKFMPSVGRIRRIEIALAGWGHR